MKLEIHHRTHYRYAAKVSFGPHRLMFRPRESYGICLENFSLTISPPHRLHWMRDLYENNVGLLELTEQATDLIIETRSLVRVSEHNPFDFIIVPEAEEYPFSYDHEIAQELAPLAVPLYPRDLNRLAEWLSPYWHPGRRIGTLEFLQHLNKGIYATFKYQRRERKGVQSPAETIECKSGSCRDFAVLFMETCRSLGLASRFVSGYMYSPKITGRMSMHAWAEVYLPGAGWIGFDPSWGILADCHYVPTAVTRHAEHAPPISGTYHGTSRDFLRTDVDLYVKRIDAPCSPSEKGRNTEEGSVRPHQPLEQSQKQSAEV